MGFFDILIETFRSLNANKTKSVLTILGIVVGIASVIVLIGAGQGSQDSITNSIRSTGSNLITISSTSQNGNSLTYEDLATLEGLPKVKNAAGFVSTQATLVQGENYYQAALYGVDEMYAEVNNVTLSAGSFINAYSNELGARIVVLGPDLVEELWEENYDAVGEEVLIGNTTFTVIGITKAKGGMGTNTDTLAYIPISTAQALFTGDSDSFSTIILEGESEEAMDTLEALTESTLLALHGLSSSDDADFRVMNQSSLLEMASSVAGTMSTLLAAIASISLVVGGIGIMNMMLTSVTERIREIGLRKTLGATPGNVTLQFLVEAVVLTVIGGLVGVLAGLIVGQLFNTFSTTTVSITLAPILIAVGVCMIIGVIFGFYPARRAAKLNPIEALRHQ